MKNINNLTQFIKSHPRAIKIVSFLGVVLLFIAFSIKPTNKTNILPNTQTTPTPVKGSINPPAEIEPFPTPKISINWNQTSIANPSIASSFTVTENLITLKNKDFIAEKMGFNESNQQKSTIETQRIWKKNDEDLLMNFSENSLYYHSNKKLTISNQYFPEETYYMEAKKAVQKIIGTEISTTLVNNNLDYFKLNKIFNIPASINDATLIRVSFYQSIEGKPVVTRSETGAIFTVFLDKKLEVYSMTITNGFLKTEEQSTKKVVPLIDFVSDKNLNIQWIDSSLGEGSNFELVTAKSINFNQDQAILGFYSSKNRIVPVYILKGSFVTGDKTGEKGTFIIPMLELNN